MQQVTRGTLALFLMIFIAAMPAAASEPPSIRAEHAALVQAVAKSPVTLRQAVQRAEVKAGPALRAGFARDVLGDLVLQVLLRSAPDAAGTYELWRGRAHDGCWVPYRRTLTAPIEVAEAAALDTLLSQMPRTLTAALLHSEGPRETDNTSYRLAVHIEPQRVDGAPRFVALAIRDTQLERLVQAPGTGAIVYSRPATAALKRIALDKTVRAHSLPPLVVKDGVWFNVTEPPTLAAFKGQPLLVVVMDPG